MLYGPIPYGRAVRAIAALPTYKLVPPIGLVKLVGLASSLTLRLHKLSTQRRPKFVHHFGRNQLRGAVDAQGAKPLPQPPARRKRGA